MEKKSFRSTVKMFQDNVLLFERDVRKQMIHFNYKIKHALACATKGLNSNIPFQLFGSVCNATFIRTSGGPEINHSLKNICGSHRGCFQWEPMGRTQYKLPQLFSLTARPHTKTSRLKFN